VQLQTVRPCARPQVVAAACLLLGAKAEETPKPLKEVVRVACRVRFAHQPAELEAVAAPVPPRARTARIPPAALAAAAGGAGGRLGWSGRMRLAVPAASSGRRWRSAWGGERGCLRASGHSCSGAS